MTESRTVKVGPKGQVVIPKAIRDEIGISPGQEVRVERVDDEVRVRRRSKSEILDELQGIFAGTPGGTKDIEEEHRRERELEEQKIRFWNG